MDANASFRSIRAAISIAVLVLILSHISLDDLVTRAKAGTFPPLAAALALLLVNMLLVSVRWHLVAKAVGLALPLPIAVRGAFLGFFGGQLLPSALGVDLLRGWVATNQVGQLPRVTLSLFADRMVGLFGAGVLVALSFGAMTAAAVLAAGALLAFLLPVAPQPMLGAAGIGVVIHGTAVAAAAITAAAYGIDSSPSLWLAIVPVSVIACGVPISINGWGVREGVFVALGASLGLAAADALLVSLTVGVLNVFASLPGAYVLARSPRL